MTAGGLRSRWLAAVASVAFTLASVLAGAQPAEGTHAFHKYSVARDGAQFAYTGVYSSRTDAVPSGLTPGPCPAIPYQYKPVYYTQWVILTTSASDWVEVGTAHGCVGQRYWFWGYGWQGGWYPLGEEWSVPLQTNYYDIHRLAEVWYWEINGLNRATKTWNAVGPRVEAGLESYNGHVDAQWVSHLSLNKTLSESVWYAWSGTTVAYLDGPEMCGQLVSATTYRTRQAAPGTAC